jgi:hypothetical protein
MEIIMVLCVLCFIICAYVVNNISKKEWKGLSILIVGVSFLSGVGFGLLFALNKIPMIENLLF